MRPWGGEPPRDGGANGGVTTWCRGDTSGMRGPSPTTRPPFGTGSHSVDAAQSSSESAKELCVSFGGALGCSTGSCTLALGFCCGALLRNFEPDFCLWGFLIALASSSPDDAAVDSSPSDSSDSSGGWAMLVIVSTALKTTAPAPI